MYCRDWSKLWSALTLLTSYKGFSSTIEVCEAGCKKLGHQLYAQQLILSPQHAGDITQPVSADRELETHVKYCPAVQSTRATESGFLG